MVRTDVLRSRRKEKLTVAASAVDLSDVDDLVVADGDTAAAVVLDDLVVSVLRASADDQNVAVAERGNGVLADVAEPDVADSAGALAVNTFQSFGANDDVLEGCAVLEDEDSVIRACVAVLASHAAVVLLVGKVQGRTLGDRTRSLEGLYSTIASRNGEGLRGDETSEESGSEELHCDDGRRLVE